MTIVTFWFWKERNFYKRQIVQRNKQVSALVESNNNQLQLIGGLTIKNEILKIEMKKLVTGIFLKKKGKFALFLTTRCGCIPSKSKSYNNTNCKHLISPFSFLSIMKVSYFINEDECIDKFRMQHLIEMAYYFPPSVLFN